MFNKIKKAYNKIYSWANHNILVVKYKIKQEKTIRRKIRRENNK